MSGDVTLTLGLMQIQRTFMLTHLSGRNMAPFQTIRKRRNRCSRVAGVSSVSVRVGTASFYLPAAANVVGQAPSCNLGLGFSITPSSISGGGVSADTDLSWLRFWGWLGPRRFWGWFGSFIFWGWVAPLQFLGWLGPLQFLGLVWPPSFFGVALVCFLGSPAVACVTQWNGGGTLRCSLRGLLKPSMSSWCKNATC